MYYKNNSVGKNLAKCALFVAIICVSAFITIPLYPVAITFQAVACLICGALLGAKYGALCTATYALIGILGVPVFSGFTGGVGSFLSPSFGYILGFIPASALCGGIIKVLKNKSFFNIFAVMLASLFVIYAVGIIYFMFVWVNLYNGASTLFNTVLFYNVFYIPKDVFIVLFSALIVQKILLHSHKF